MEGKTLNSNLRPITNKQRISRKPSFKKRYYFKGVHETHVSDGSEGELHTRDVDCKKNPGHTEFIPVDKFTLEHLPKGQRDPDLYELIKSVADLTVKVNVTATSSQRPEFLPNTNVPYPFNSLEERGCLRTGSGMLYYVYKYTDGVNQYGDKHWKDFIKCPCTRCETSLSPSDVWFQFGVATATHMVFDEHEASHTTLRLFFDSQDSSVVVVDKVNVVDVNVAYDRCMLKSVTCDQNLGDKLRTMWGNYFKAWRKVMDKYKNSRSASKLTFIVSHPHGCTKQVSLGRWRKKHKMGRGKRQFSYTTCTCQGSSGAAVFCVGYQGWGWWSYNTFVHHGTESKI